MNEVKNSIERICSRVQQMEDRISKLGNRNFKINQLKENKEKRIKRKERLHDL